MGSVPANAQCLVHLVTAIICCWKQRREFGYGYFGEELCIEYE